MANVSYPGVYREELKSRRQVTAGSVTTSNLALVGFFEKGPTDEPILVEGPREFENVFGSANSKSIAPTIANKFFQNGGSRAYVVRVTADDAKSASGAQLESIYDESLGTTSSSNSTTLGVTLSEAPVEPNTVVINVPTSTNQTESGIADSKTTGTISATLQNPPVYPESLEITIPDGGSGIIVKDTGDGHLDEDGGNNDVGYVNYHTGYFEIEAGNLSSTPSGNTDDVDAEYEQSSVSSYDQDVTVDNQASNQRVFHGKVSPRTVIDGSIQFKWKDQQSTDLTATAYPDGNIFNDNDDILVDDPIGSFDFSTGEFEINTGALEVDSTLDVDKRNWNYNVIQDDGDGGLDGDNVNTAGDIDYSTGEITNLEIGTTNFDFPILGNFDHQTHIFEADNVGANGNNFRVRIVGNPNEFDNSTGQYQEFTVFVDEDQGGNVGFVNLETFSGVTLTDTTADTHISQKINDSFLGSDLISVVPDISDIIPTLIRGGTRSGVLIDVGDGTQRDVKADLDLRNGFINFGGEGELLSGTLKITYTDASGNSREITDDKQGNLQGDVQAGGTVDYQTGVVSFAPQYSIQSSTDVTAEYTFSSAEDVSTNGFSGGANGSAITKDHVTDFNKLKADKKGIYAFDDVSGELLNLTAPDFAGDSTAEGDMITYAENREDTMVLVSPPQGASPTQALNYKRNVLSSRSARGAMYHPWITIDDPLSNNTKTIPPMGHVAGVWARTDQNRNIGKAPAGTQDGVLRSLQQLNQTFTNKEVGRMYDGNINSLFAPPERPATVWGARTLQTNGEYRYIQRRRTMDFTAVTIQKSILWAVFENIGPNLWTSLREQIRGILRRFFSRGLYAGTSESEAFEIQIDEQNNPPSVQQAGEVVIDWAIALNTPAEFIRQRHRQKLGN